MTITADYAPNIDLGNGTTTAFAVNFPFGAKTDLVVTLFNTATSLDLSPAPVLNGGGTYDYTVSGTPNADTGIYPSGTVTFNTAPPSTYKVVRQRVTPSRQNAVLTNNGPFPAKTVEGMSDRAEMQLQEHGDLLSRALVAPSEEGAADMGIPVAAARGGRLLGFDPSTFKPIASTKSDSEITAAVDIVNTLLAAGAVSPATIEFDTVAAMLAFTVPSVLNSMLVYARGRNAVGDGAAGFFRVTSAAPSVIDNGITFQSTASSSYYFVRQFAGPALSVWYDFRSTNSAAANDAPMQALMDSGYPVHFVGPLLTFQINTLKTITANGFCATFDPGLTIVQNGANTDSTIFYATGKSHITITGGIFTPGGTTAAVTQGWAIHFQSCTNCWAVTNEVTAHRRGGVIINSGTRSGWRDLYVHDSIVDPAHGDTHADSGYGGLLANGCNDCHGIGGRSYKGAGIEFAMQTIDTNGGAGYTMQHNSISVDSIVLAPMYGMMAYSLTNTDVWKDNALRVKLIDTVTGAVPHADNGFVYGAGVYIQGAESTTLDFDIIRNTNVNTLVETLVPAAVGVTNCRNVVINGKLIENANWYGVALFDPNGTGDATSGVGADVQVGEIRNAAAGAVFCKDFPYAKIRAKVIGGVFGFRSINSATTSAKRYDLRDFIADGTSATAIQADDGDVYISGGYTKPTSAGNCCVEKSTSGRLYIENHLLDGSLCATWPLDIAAGAGRCAFGAGVRLISNAGGTHAGAVARIYQPVRGIETAIFENASATPSTAFSGTYGIVNALTDVASPTVTDCKLVINAGSTSITGFTGMEEGQEIELFCGANVTLVHSTYFYLAGAADKAMVVGNSITLRQVNGIIFQLGAMAA